MLAGLLVLQHIVSIPRLMTIYDARPAQPSRARLTPDRLAYLATLLVHLTLRDRYCMKRSLLIFHFLRKWGYDASIHFGVERKEGVLRGHAWIELNGEPVYESVDPRGLYATTFVYPDLVDSRGADDLESPSTEGQVLHIASSISDRSAVV